MCNRYVSPTQAEIERFWHIGRHNNQLRLVPGVFPRSPGAFIRPASDATGENELVVGQWGLIPFFAKSAKLPYSTNNARFEEIGGKASFKHSWLHGRRCIIPATSFDEPCWETGRNVWWQFRRADGSPWGLGGLWNTWTDPETGEVVDSYTMLTINADTHPLMSRMHKPDLKLPPDKQDKRSVVAIELPDVAQWLYGSLEEASSLVRPPLVEVLDARALTASAE